MGLEMIHKLETWIPEYLKCPKSLLTKVNYLEAHDTIFAGTQYHVPRKLWKTSLEFCLKTLRIRKKWSGETRTKFMVIIAYWYCSNNDGANKQRKEGTLTWHLHPIYHRTLQLYDVADHSLHFCRRHVLPLPSKGVACSVLEVEEPVPVHREDVTWHTEQDTGS